MKPKSRKTSLRTSWTKQKIIQLIKAARRSGKPLNWTAAISGKSPLSRAARAAVRPHFFGSWARALHAAGLHEEDIRLRRQWDKHTILWDLRQRLADQLPISASAIRAEDPALYAAASRHFGAYSAAIKAAQKNRF